MHGVGMSHWILGVCWLLLGGAAPAHAADAAPLSINTAPGHAELADGSPAPETIVLERTWDGTVCTSRLTNTGTEPVNIGRVVLFRIAHTLPPETGLYGEGFTMLSQTGGTLGSPADLGDYTDAKHYKIPQPDDATTVYGLVLLTPPSADTALLGFTSCRRFVGRFHLRADFIEAVLDTEGQALGAGETWALESFLAISGTDRAALLDTFAAQLNANHPRLAFEPIPTGWCSWYCYGPMVTQDHVKANLDAVDKLHLPLKYIQIDDGYQAAMGDWLDTGKAFGGGIRNVLDTIRQAGREPAIWVAPFVAQEDSKVFQEHPDWFIKDDAGQPLRSDKVTFGGWRLGPWYALDGTHPGAQKHLEEVFRTMRNDWGCTYFKLDANFWGAMHGGHFHDPKATRVEAYRRGMEAVLRGAGDAFILGCNHPLWPSLGLIHGSRSSGDISRSWNTFQHTARENFHRNWQNGRLWWNDPDCVLLTGKLSDDEFQFHASVMFAAGGMTLSGDNLTVLPPERLAMLRKLLPPSGHAARFSDEAMEIGVVEAGDTRHVCFFNWGETPRNLGCPVGQPSHARDFWSGEDLGLVTDTLRISDLPPHAARIITLTPEPAACRQVSDLGIRHSFLVTGTTTAIFDEDAHITWEIDVHSHDGYVLDNGNVLISDTKSAKEYRAGTTDVIWSFMLSPENQELGTMVRLPSGDTMLVERGAKPRILEVGPDGAVKRETPLLPETDNIHMQTRMARKLANGNYLVPHLLAFKVKEYTPNGNVVNEIQTDLEELGGRAAENWPFTAIRLDNGNTLVNLTHGNKVVEFDAAGKVAWRVDNADVADRLSDPCGGQRLPNGNTIICSYGQRDAEKPRIFEVTPGKKVVWEFFHPELHAHEVHILTTNGVKVSPVWR